MVDSHFYSFFGQNTGLMVNSSSKSEPYLFMRFIKRKSNTTWEKPSSGEGKVIKFSLEEIILILQVLNKNSLNWTSYHSYKNQKTPISFSWEDKDMKSLWINIANYSKMLNAPQTEILRLLLTHILNEKIEHATIINRNKNQKLNFNLKEDYTKIQDNNEDLNLIEIDGNHIDSSSENIALKSNSSNVKTKPKKSKTLMKEINDVEGSIKGETEKALLIIFNSGNEIWIPKSTIHSEFNHQKNDSQVFSIDEWILKKNKIIS